MVDLGTTAEFGVLQQQREIGLKAEYSGEGWGGRIAKRQGHGQRMENN